MPQQAVFSNTKDKGWKEKRENQSRQEEPTPITLSGTSTQFSWDWNNYELQYISIMKDLHSVDMTAPAILFLKNFQANNPKDGGAGFIWSSCISPIIALCG